MRSWQGLRGLKRPIMVPLTRAPSDRLFAIGERTCPADQAGINAAPDHQLDYRPQDIARSEATVPVLR